MLIKVEQSEYIVIGFVRDGYYTVNAMQNAITADSQTAFMGTSCLLTLCQNLENGIAPSLENA